MIFNIPQFIDKEDKIVGPFTAKQLGWFAAGVAILLLLYSFLDFVTFIISGLPVILMSVAFAYLKPNGQPLIYFIIYSVRFFFKPEMFIWKRLPIITAPIKRTAKKAEVVKSKQSLEQEKIREIAALLDRQQSS